MSDFSQNGIISTLHDFGTKSISDIEKELKDWTPSIPDMEYVKYDLILLVQPLMAKHQYSNNYF